MAVRGKFENKNNIRVKMSSILTSYRNISLTPHAADILHKNKTFCPFSLTVKKLKMRRSLDVQKQRFLFFRGSTWLSHDKGLLFPEFYSTQSISIAKLILLIDN